MNVNVDLSKEWVQKLHDASDALGVDEKEVLRRAVLLYLDDLEKRLALKKEWAAWDSASDEALLRFEKSL